MEQHPAYLAKGCIAVHERRALPMELVYLSHKLGLVEAYLGARITGIVPLAQREAVQEEHVPMERPGHPSLCTDGQPAGV